MTKGKAKVESVHSKRPKNELGQTYWEAYYDARGDYHDQLMGAQRTIGFETVVAHAVTTDTGVDIRLVVRAPFDDGDGVLLDVQFAASNIVSGLEEAGQRILKHAEKIIEERVKSEVIA